MKIYLAGHELILHHSGIVLWPALRCAIVADLHLEKGSHFARRGYFIPPYDTHETLLRLHQVCREEKIGELVILGDCFHDRNGFSRMSPGDRALFHDLAAYGPVWVRGNHDGDFVPDGFPAYDVFERSGVFFRHEAETGVFPEISGHFHPKAEISHKGAQMRRSCFIEDGRKMILPAFGAYTGGLDVRDPVISHHFPAGYRLYVPGESRVYRL